MYILVNINLENKSTTKQRQRQPQELKLRIKLDCKTVVGVSLIDCSHALGANKQQYPRTYTHDKRTVDFIQLLDESIKLIWSLQIWKV